MIKYLGSKRTLVPTLLRVVGTLASGGTVIDLFSGTSRVGYALKGRGFRVLANDHNAYAETLARCYVEADAEQYLRHASALIDEFNRLPGRPGYFTETFCERSRFFQPRNGARIDAIREEIDRKGLDPVLRAVLLTSLMEAADRVDSTVGLQMAYLKEWAPRAFADIELRVPELLPRAASGHGRAYRLDALDAARQLHGDIAYLDPPYNQHKYLGNYHVWESLVLWDKPEVYGVACKRIDCRTRDSAFNARNGAVQALRSVVLELDAPTVILSYSDEGFATLAEIESILRVYPFVARLDVDYKRHVGSQIGIHDARGVKVGTVGRAQRRTNLRRDTLTRKDPRCIRRQKRALRRKRRVSVTPQPGEQIDSGGAGVAFDLFTMDTIMCVSDGAQLFAC